MAKEPTNFAVEGGFRVLEVGHFVAALFCRRLLAHLGADVIKIEPRFDDPVRRWGEMVNGGSLGTFPLGAWKIRR